MKVFLTFATLLFAATVQATPAVGDYSNFNLTLSQNGATYNGSYEVSLTAKTPTGYVLSSVISITGQPAERAQESVATDDLLSDATIASALGNCAAYGGQAEQLVVAAGTFATCAIPNEEGKVWIAKVPFGIVKQTQLQSDGSNLTLELKNFVVGQ
jgi:hypothetical protein